MALLKPLAALSPSLSLQEWEVRSTCFPKDLFVNSEYRGFAAGTVVLHGCDMEWAAWTLCTALFPGAKAQVNV